ncbi:relaxase/mobilization nuclease domain-containing protein [Sphingobium sp. AN558]|uniref:relaxase/mobilization nuclease domain-containing protein n=1 Tax=Sphingobium sp. AN558 TaxID=3133442 RepID=UPI0030BFF2C3
MILKASQRGGGMQLGAHLLKEENEHLEIHEIRGFASDNLLGAMKEAQAVAQGTRCKQYLFSVSLNPPDMASPSIEAFEAAIDRIEEKNGLTGQPRMIVFHEKEGRRHAHAVWSRIDADTMTAQPLPFFKMKLREISKGLYLEHGWQMPRGLMDSKERDVRNFTLAEWQQAKRAGHDPKIIKATIQECWVSSGNRAEFSKALEGRGLYLAKGDSRAYVALTIEGEVMSIPRMVGIKAKDIIAKLGKPDDMRNVADTKQHIANVIAPKLKELIAIADKARAKELAPLLDRRTVMKELHTTERQKLDEGQRVRAISEAKVRAERLRGGVAGLWDRFTGQRSATVKQNETEVPRHQRHAKPRLHSQSHRLAARCR